MIEKKFEPELQEYIFAGQVMRVLVVDDSQAIRAAIRDRLELGNLEVIEASCGQQALTILEEQLPDLVLLDVVMPGMDGITALKRLRARYSKYQLPIIPIVNLDAASEIVRALDCGANDYVTKPIDFDVLWARMTNQLMQKQAAEYLRIAQQSLEQQVRLRTAELSSNNQKLQRVIQEKLLVEDQLQRQANYDALTGLPNRNLARDRLGQAIAKAKRHKLNPCVAFLDLDNFKHVNDTLGHEAGDKLLAEAARRLSGCARKCDTVARLGGDEFLLILEDSHEPSRPSRVIDLQRIGERVIERFSRPFTLDGVEISVSPSIGFAMYPRDGTDGNVLMRHADAAMYRAKNQGKNGYSFYTSELTTKSNKQQHIESELHRALGRNEFSLCYQPIVDVRTGRITSAETSLRWDNPRFGTINADQLIKIAERTGSIVPIGKWMIQAACEQLRLWRESGASQLSVVVNISARQLQARSAFCQEVRDAMTANALTADALQLELSEGEMISDTPAIDETIKELKSIGAGLIVKDFGTGHASLSKLQHYHIDVIKIDRKHICQIADNRQDAKLVIAMMAMASSLDISVLCDGVDSGAVMSFLRNTCCRFAQGDHLCRPLSADEFGALLDRAVNDGRNQSVDSANSPAAAPQDRVILPDSGAENMLVTGV